MSLTVKLGDAFDVLADLEPCSVSAFVTDPLPPYGLEFMGKSWDVFREDDPATSRNRGDRAGDHGEAREKEDQRGAFGRVAYGGGKRPTTSRCTGCGKRDQFRKPHGCDDARWATELIDPHAAPPTALAFQAWCREWARLALRALKPGGYLLAFGGTRTYHRLASGVEDAGFDVRDTIAWLHAQGFPKSLNLDGEWSGWGTALKPGHEPIVCARKPLTGGVAVNVAEHGTGALHIDAARIDGAPVDRTRTTALGRMNDDAWEPRAQAYTTPDAGRWPTNVALDEDAAAALDGDAPQRAAGNRPARRTAGAEGYNGWPTGTEGERVPLEGGGVSRVYFVAKADQHERHAGLAIPSLFTPTDAPAENDHPTVKPVDLMRWLVRLVTPPGGLVVDPFLGSGATGIACALEGVDFLGIEQDAESVAVARARIAHWSNGNGEAAGDE